MYKLANAYDGTYDYANQAYINTNCRQICTYRPIHYKHN